MKIAKYENLHIGNFLISTGFYLRELTDSLTGVLPVSINPTQQSGKADHTIGRGPLWRSGRKVLHNII